MSSHEQFADDLALYSLGALTGDERATLEKHLEDCPACRRELDALRADMASLALSAPQQAPPPRARQRLLSAIAKEPRVARERPRAAWLSFVPSLAAPGLAFVALLLWHQDGELQRKVADLNRANAQIAEQAQRSSEVLATLSDPTAAHFTLSAAKTPPQPLAKTIYARNRGSLVFMASNFAALPADKAYELWLIPTTGAPIPAGVFVPDANGGAVVINPPLPPGVEAKTFAVTVEPKAGSAAPTSQPIMVGVGG